MAADRAEISSLHSTLAQLVDRVVSLADSAQRDRDERTAGDLYAVERSLLAAKRRLEQLVEHRR